MEEKTRAEKLMEAGIARHGSESAWRAFLRESAKKAKHTKPQGFAYLKLNNPDKLKEISIKGGQYAPNKQNKAGDN